jgi:hypothetical protein
VNAAHLVLLSLLIAALASSCCCPGSYACRSDPYCVSNSDDPVENTTWRTGCGGARRVPPPCRPGTNAVSIELLRSSADRPARLTVEGYAILEGGECDRSIEAFRGGRYRCSSTLALSKTPPHFLPPPEIGLLRRGPRGPSPYRCEGDRSAECCDLPVDSRRLAVTLDLSPSGGSNPSKHDYVVEEVCSLDQGRKESR